MMFLPIVVSMLMLLCVCLVCDVVCVEMARGSLVLWI